MTKRNGSGPKRPRRRASVPTALRAATDDRPQGFQRDRMREVWATIDDARAKLAPPPPAPKPSSSLSRLSGFVPSVVWALTPCALLARAGDMLAIVPGIDRLSGLFRSDSSS